MKRFLCYLLCPLLLTACAKDIYTSVTFKGNLLVSTSNPVPVPGYILTFMSSKNGGQLDSNLSSVLIFVESITSNASGYFEGQIKGDKNSSTIAANPVSASGFPSIIPQVDWRGLSFSSRDLGTVYLYKKVNRAILAVSAKTGIIPSDTLFTTANTTGGYVEKAITNLSIPAGTSAYSLDTISNVIFTRYSFTTHQYYNDITIRKSGTASRFTVASNETEGDEAEKAYVIDIP